MSPFRGGRASGPGPKGSGWWINAFLLLLIADKPSHGYELISRLKELGIYNPIGIGHMGRIYRNLTQLETSGLITFSWDTTVSPPRKVYNITSLGLSFLDNIFLELSTFKESLDKFIEMYKRIRESNNNK